MEYLRKCIWIVVVLCTFGALAFTQNPKRYNLEIGQRFALHTEVEQTITQEIPGMGNVEINQNIVSEQAYEVKSRSSKGNYIIGVTYEFSEMTSNMSGQETKMSSEEEGENHLVFSKLKGKGFQFEITPLGEVVGFHGLDDFRKAYAKDLEGTQYETQMEELLTAYSDENMNTEFSKNFFIYSGDNQKSWNRSSQVKINELPTTTDTRYFWDTESDNTLLAESKLTISGSLSSMGMDMDTEMEGTQQTIFDLDDKTGLPLLIQNIQEIEGKLVVPSANMEIPQKIKTTAKTSLKYL